MYIIFKTCKIKHNYSYCKIFKSFINSNYNNLSNNNKNNISTSFNRVKLIFYPF